ncbi:MAG: molybdopterin-guanine dinucleotide biosynthesis protein B [Candidatus Thorarchaeota archaeon]|jgi:molybdopterin-guanine dinucleotide biosynthesis protein B
MRVFAVSGFSFSGKTFLLEQIIQRLTSEGLTVTSIKSSAEDINAPEGTDTWRHGKAGANPTVIVGPGTSTIRFSQRVKIADVAKSLKTDYLLLEGFKKLEVPKFWCIGEESEPIKELPKSVKAIVIWEGTTLDTPIEGVPTMSNAEVESLVDIVKSESVDINSITE